MFFPLGVLFGTSSAWRTNTWTTVVSSGPSETSAWLRSTLTTRLCWSRWWTRRTESETGRGRRAGRGATVWAYAGQDWLHSECGTGISPSPSLKRPTLYMTVIGCVPADMKPCEKDLTIHLNLNKLVLSVNQEMWSMGASFQLLLELFHIKMTFTGFLLTKSVQHVLKWNKLSREVF